jgi:hypothetical protein
MNDVENELVQILREFTAKVADAVKRHALVSAGAALGKASNGQVGAARAARRPGSAAATVARSEPATKQLLDAEAVGDQVVSYLKATPGLRTEELAAALQVPTDGLKPLIKKLVAGGRLRREGQARGTRYFAGARGGKAKRAPRVSKSAATGRKRGKRSRG